MSNANIKSNSTLVYSTDSGRLCPRCNRPMAECICKQLHSFNKGDGIVRVTRETKGRGGKSVSVIQGLGLAPTELEKLCTTLKKRCGTGGTTKDGNIEIQGEHRDTLVAELTKLGFTVKKSGG
ncbi:MAG: translation initiation factor Sui1 [Steroidobacteraceae bacterium]